MSDMERKASSEKPRRKRGIPPIVLIAAGLALIAYVSLNLTRSGQARRIAELESIAAKLGSETVPLRFMVLKREGGAIELRVRLYDLSDAEIAKFELALPGKELFFDFLLSPLQAKAEGAANGDGSGPRWLAFPYRIFTDTMPAAEGELLFARYDRSGFPRIFEGRAEELPVLTAAEKLSLASLFARLRGEAASGRAAGKGSGAGASGAGRSDFGSAVHELSALSRFEKGLVYKIVCRAKGGIEIVEDDR